MGKRALHTYESWQDPAAAERTFWTQGRFRESDQQAAVQDSRREVRVGTGRTGWVLMAPGQQESQDLVTEQLGLRKAEKAKLPVSGVGGPVMTSGSCKASGRRFGGSIVSQVTEKLSLGAAGKPGGVRSRHCTHGKGRRTGLGWRLRRVPPLAMPRTSAGFGATDHVCVLTPWNQAPPRELKHNSSCYWPSSPVR